MFDVIVAINGTTTATTTTTVIATLLLHCLLLATVPYHLFPLVPIITIILVCNLLKAAVALALRSIEVDVDSR